MKSLSSSSSQGFDGNARWVLANARLDKPDKVLICVSGKPLILPGACCRCGAKTKTRFWLKVHPPKKEQNKEILAGFIGGHVGHLVGAVAELGRLKVEVPCCQDCRLIHRTGFLAGVFVVLLGIALMVGPMFFEHEKKLRMSVAVPLLLMFGGIFVIFAGVTVSNWISSYAVPVAVHRLPVGLLYYEFRSKRYQQLLSGYVNPESVQ